MNFIMLMTLARWLAMYYSDRHYNNLMESAVKKAKNEVCKNCPTIVRKWYAI